MKKKLSHELDYQRIKDSKMLQKVVSLGFYFF